MNAKLTKKSIKNGKYTKQTVIQRREIANGYKEKCWTFLIISEMEAKATYLLIPVTIATIHTRK